MAAILGMFLLWLFASGNYKDWSALLTGPVVDSPMQNAPASATATKSGSNSNSISDLAGAAKSIYDGYSGTSSDSGAGSGDVVSSTPLYA